MDQVHISDKDWSPPSSASSTTPFDLFLLSPNKGEFVTYPAWSSPPPFVTHFQPTDKAQALKKPLYTNPKYGPPRPLVGGFERPRFIRIAIFTVLCLTAYPLLYILTLVAKDKSLFTVRLIVAMWCSGIGFSLGYILFRIGIRHLEAATWATVIHMSYKGGGMKLCDLASFTQHPTSLWAASRIFLSRFWNRQTMRDSRSSYDKRPWSLFLGFIMLHAILGPMLPFLFGRIMEIDTFVRNQHDSYHEVLIAGDLSKEDVDWVTTSRQLHAVLTFAQTWTLLPYGSSTPDTAQFVYENDTVYFAQPSLSQFVPGGSGAGNLNQSQLVWRETPNNTLATRDASKNDGGALLRYSQWGTRIHCEKLPNPEVNLIPSWRGSVSYALVPQDLLRRLFGVYGMDLPNELRTAPHPTADDIVLSTMDLSKISFWGKWWDTNVSHSFYSKPMMGTDVNRDQAWTTVETVLIRLNTSFTPSGRFPVYSNESVPDVNGTETKIGYDAAVCVQKYEPWVIETYNSSIGSPTILRIVEKGSYGNPSLLPIGSIQGIPRYLNTTGKDDVYDVAHDNGINQMIKDNGRDQPYSPSPITISFTEGTGPEGYIELSPSRFSTIRAQIDAANVLPFFAGSGSIVAQSYPDQTLAYVTYKQWQLITILVVILILGVTGELFVPMLPLNTPRRGFGVYSWLALFQSQELRFDVDDDLKLMSLDELEKKMSDKQVKFCWD